MLSRLIAAGAVYALAGGARGIDSLSFGFSKQRKEVPHGSVEVAGS